MTLENFYAFMKMGAIHYPTNATPSATLQTFGVITSLQDISLENLGKTVSDRNKPFFYSRLWDNYNYDPNRIAFDFPAILVYDLGYTIDNVFKHTNTNCHQLQIMAVDVYKEEACVACINPNSKESRTINEVYNDTEEMLYNYLHYIKDVSVTTEGNLYNSKFFDYLTIQGLTNGQVIDVRATKGLFQNLKDKNAAITGFRWEGKSANMLYGTIINLNICLDRCEEFNFDFTQTMKGQSISSKCC